MTYSQNGWPVLGRGDLHWFDAAGGRFAAANADVVVVAREFIERFNAEVEKIHGPVLDDWSWAVRNVRGSQTVISNHSSATAWDLNATQHPRGVHGTFSKSELTKLRQIRNAITDDHGRPVLRLGADFTTVVDAMHAEVNATAAQVKQAANKIRAKQEDDVTDKDIDKIVEKVTAAVLAKVADAVWNSDRVPVNDLDTGKPADAKNPTWQGDSVLTELLNLARRNAEDIAALKESAGQP